MSIKLSNNFDNVRSLFCSPGLGLLKGFVLIDHSFNSSSKINDHETGAVLVLVGRVFKSSPS